MKLRELTENYNLDLIDEIWKGFTKKMNNEQQAAYREKFNFDTIKDLHNEEAFPKDYLEKMIDAL